MERVCEWWFGGVAVGRVVRIEAVVKGRKDRVDLIEEFRALRGQIRAIEAI